METRMKSIVCALFVFIFTLSAHAADPAFPKISQIEIEFYQTEVTLTDEDQDVTVLATEYYDKSVPRSRLDTLILGNKFSVYYNNETDQILEVNTTNCQVWQTDESLFDYQPMFYGWLNKKPLIIGPTAPIWYAQDHLNEIVPLGETIVRDIKCQAYSLNILDSRQNLTYTYYFAEEGWTTPFKLNDLRVPIRIEVRGKSSKDSAQADMFRPVNQITDFTYFRPTIEDRLTFQPPVGIGCPLRKSTRTVPTFPKVFTYVAEVVDLMKEEEVTTVEYQRIWYDSDRKIARLDNYTRTRFTSEFYDFNTGVTYTISDGETCQIKPLKNSFFEGYDGKVIGHLKDPNEVLNLDGSFYYMGKKLIRSIWADAFESAKMDVTFMGRSLSRLVVTIYYSQDFYKVVVNGEVESQIPIFYVVTGWVNNKIVISLQYNIFAFDDVIWPDIYQTFGVESCYPTMMDKSYFIIPLPNVDPKLGAKMEELNDVIMEQLRIKISRLAQISPMRLPLLTADYKNNGVYINGLMLDRPPSLKQFINRGNEDHVDNPNMKIIFDAATREDCASACIDDGGNVTCTGFHFCNQACFITTMDFDPADKGVPQGMCEVWGRAERNSGLGQAKIKEALVLLEASILNGDLKISIQLNTTTSETILVSDVYFGDGPFNGKNDQEKPYRPIIKYRQLNVNDETTMEMPYMDNVNDCYLSCKKSESISCSSFSYCPDSTNKQCRISSILVADKNHKQEDLEDARDCFVYSMTYLDYYEPLAGKSVLVSGDDVYKKIPSVEACAKTCRLEAKFACRGFEYCRATQSCVLHSKHILDLKPGDITTSSKTTCTHYSAKFSADYYDMGYTLLDDTSDVRTMLTIEECARTCSEQLKGNCKSFNYCPESGPGFGDNSCALSSKTLTDSKVTTTTKGKCHHYEKKKEVDDWGTTKVKSNTVSTSGYTSKGFTGLVIGMLALGLVLGAIGFLVFSYFRSKQSGEGMSVRFMKSDI